jgi:hypothetical protein
MYQYGSSEVDKDNYNRLLSAESFLFEAIPHANAQYQVQIAADAVVMLDTFSFPITKGAGTPNLRLDVNYVTDSGIIIPVTSRTIATAANTNIVVACCRDIETFTATTLHSVIRLPSMSFMGVTSLLITVANTTAAEVLGTLTGLWRQLREDG